MMTNLVSTTLKRLNSHSLRRPSSYTTRNLSATPQPPNLETQSITSDIPPAKKKRGSVWLWYMFGFITYGLGDFFQHIHSIVTKEHLDLRRQCLEMEPMKLNTIKNVDELGYRRVVCKGIFDVQRSIYVGPKPRSMSKGSENGFYVITPLLPIPNEPNSMKSPILVNRGWVPSDWKGTSQESLDTGLIVAATNDSTKAKKLHSSRRNFLSMLGLKFNHPMMNIAKEQVSKGMNVKVVGVVKTNETPSHYTLTAYPRSLAWFYLDVPKLAQAMGLGEDTIYIENTCKDMDEGKSSPVPRDVENLIWSKDLPQDFHITKVYCIWSSMFCFGKAKTILLAKYSKLMIDISKIQMIMMSLGAFLSYICFKIYKFRSLFHTIDTIGVGCVTKLDPVKPQEDICQDLDNTREKIPHVKDILSIAKVKDESVRDRD